MENTKEKGPEKGSRAGQWLLPQGNCVWFLIWIREDSRARNFRQIQIDKDQSWRGFPGGAVVKNPSANTGNTGSSPGLGRSHVLQSN